MVTAKTTDKAPPQAQGTIKISNKMTVGAASLVMAAMIGLSRITGFGRMILVSHLYATRPEAAVFEAAFNIPDTITILIAGGALATGFVPVFTEYLSRGEEEAARRTFRAMWTLLGTAFGVISLILFALTFTPWGAKLAPQKVPPQYIDLYLRLLRILLAAQFFFVLGGLFSGTLNALRLFWYPALQPVLFNCGIIFFGILLPWKFGMGIESQAWGALLGAVVGSLIIQMPAVLRNGLSLRPLWDLNDAGVRRVLASLLPIVFGLASGQIIALNLPRFYAGYALPPADLPAIGYTNRLMQVPLDLLASGPAIALFPTLSLLSAQGNLNELRLQLSGALRRTLLLTLLATALLAALRFPIIHLLLEHGKFDKADTKYTSPVLLCYSLCIVGLGAQQMLARGFYALKDTRTPVFIGLGAMALFYAFGKLFLTIGPGGASGLALAAACSTSLLAIAMWLALRSKLKGWDEGATGHIIWKATLAALATYFVAFYVARYGIQFITAKGWDSKLTPSLLKIAARLGVLVLGAIGGTITFLLIARVLKVKEISGNGGKWRKAGKANKVSTRKRRLGESKVFGEVRF
ncbi:MAG: murein biosynthesis integral membrane protein MurJ [Abitibacteriaceae bacterium]|nr:murein biosynthesis integral membrane protein MurJ [Abditibacteriaceae bacterium]MBV9868230.1 murein biosynthesis integral membrane protein MurJ [Abditibacteriaceae bacterium]